ncbi:unnamed protein product, partial [Anisakis simplex]|uniref:Arrestin_N domain-containing protein n=1 Tax=Anisakis simplex TaxID=6269 RepID=A0A0M3KFE0_ANISI
MAADGSVLMESSQPISVVKPSHSSQAPTAYGNSISTPASTQKIIDLKKSYSIIVNMQLPKTSFKPTEPIFPCITINNGWKASLKYVHFNIVQKIAYNAKPNGSLHLKTFTKMVDLTGVGLPATQKKIAPGSSFTFSPEYYVPALIPSFEIPHFLKVDYVAKLTIGHSPNQIF